MTERCEWAEPLPDGCPPEDAWEPDDEVYFRLVDDPDNPKPEDFYSARKLTPNRNFRDISECETRGLSVFDTVDACRSARKLGKPLRRKQVAKVTLPPECGEVLQTRGPSHHCWWLKADFDPVSICEQL